MIWQQLTAFYPKSLTADQNSVLLAPKSKGILVSGDEIEWGQAGLILQEVKKIPGNRLFHLSILPIRQSSWTGPLFYFEKCENKQQKNHTCNGKSDWQRPLANLAMTLRKLSLRNCLFYWILCIGAKLIQMSITSKIWTGPKNFCLHSVRKFRVIIEQTRHVLDRVTPNH